MAKFLTAARKIIELLFYYHPTPPPSILL